MDYRLLRAYTPFVWGAGVLGLAAVLIPGVGSTVNGARAWISFPGGFQIQPAELAKISIIVGMAMILAETKESDHYPTHSDVVKGLLVAAIPVLLIVAQPDLGTTVIIAAAVVTIIGVSGAPARWVVGLLLVAVIGGFVIAIIDNGLGLIGLASGLNLAVTGAVLLLAATADALSRRKSRPGN